MTREGSGAGDALNTGLDVTTGDGEAAEEGAGDGDAGVPTESDDEGDVRPATRAAKSRLSSAGTRKLKRARSGAGKSGRAGPTDARSYLRASRGACLRYLCLYAYLVKYRDLTEGDRGSLREPQDFAATVVGWCDGTADAAYGEWLETLTVDEARATMHEIQQVWDNPRSGLKEFHEFVVETLQVGLMEDKGGVTFQASYQDAPTGVLNLGEEESDSSSSSSSEDEDQARAVSGKASAASGKALVTGSTRSRGKVGASRGWVSDTVMSSWIGRGVHLAAKVPQERPCVRGAYGFRDYVAAWLKIGCPVGMDRRRAPALLETVWPGQRRDRQTFRAMRWRFLVMAVVQVSSAGAWRGRGRLGCRP